METLAVRLPSVGRRSFGHHKGLLELAGWDVAETATEATGVVPVNPAEGCELKFFDRSPEPRAGGSGDKFGLAAGVHGLGQGIVVAVGDRSGRGSLAGIGGYSGLSRCVRMGRVARRSPVNQPARRTRMPRFRNGQPPQRDGTSSRLRHPQRRPRETQPCPAVIGPTPA